MTAGRLKVWNDGAGEWEYVNAPGGSSPVVVSDTDPGATGAGTIWVDTSTDPPTLNIRNGADDAWVCRMPPQWTFDPATGALVIVLTGAAGDHDFTFWLDVTNSDDHELFTADSSGQVAMGAYDEGASPLTVGTLDAGTIGVLAQVAGSHLSSDRGLSLISLPTSNPGPGLIWNDGGTLKVGT